MDAEDAWVPGAGDDEEEAEDSWVPGVDDETGHGEDLRIIMEEGGSDQIEDDSDVALHLSGFKVKEEGGSDQIEDDSDVDFLEELNTEQGGANPSRPFKPYMCKCLQQFTEGSPGGIRLKSLQDALQSSSHAHVDAIIHAMLRKLEQTRIHLGHKRIEYTLFENPVCKQCWKHLLHIGGSRFQKLFKSTFVPQDGRILNGAVATQSLHVDAYLYSLYNKLGEPLANLATNDGLSALKEEPLDEFQEHIEQQKVVNTVLSGGSSSSSTPSSRVPILEASILPKRILESGTKETGPQGLDTRWLHHCTVQEIFEGYQDWCCTEAEPCIASRSTFYVAWQAWRTTLRILPPCSHGKCDVCSKMKGYLKKITDPEKRAELMCEYRAHIAGVMTDRRVGTRIVQQATESTSANLSAFDSVLHVLLDGMDKSKFAVPRNIDGAKAMQDIHRPRLTVIGALVAGIGEYYYFLDPDQEHGGNALCQIIAATLDRVDVILGQRPY